MKLTRKQDMIEVAECAGGSVLREVKTVRQLAGEPRCRWFSSTRMDLFVWINDVDQVIAYQLTYNKPHDEKALSWSEEHGFSYQSVDEGARPGKHPGSPLLISDGVIDVARVASLLEKNTGDLDVTIKAFILDNIRQLS